MSLETFFDNLVSGRPDPGQLEFLTQAAAGWTMERLELPDGVSLRRLGPQGREVTVWLGVDGRVRSGNWILWSAQPPRFGTFGLDRGKLILEDEHPPRSISLPGRRHCLGLAPGLILVVVLSWWLWP
ncbi:MAG: hypothetical protein KC910_35965, partial [Candidatus Eremiobacteraeota bacterium]|nr:hypothetical protein [Candidatus Eremiobacteraeota bacterium]